MTDKLGSLIIDVADKELSAEEKDLLAHPLVGGVIFFTRNYESRAQVMALSKAIRKVRKDPLLIMVDQEGGRVQRFIKEFTRLPPMHVFGKLYDENPEKACRLASECAWLMASELLSVGIDLSLAPVLDLDKGLSSVIGNRSFHADPERVITLASAFIAGMKGAGMAATGKHFPGHGSVTLDSHLALPIDERNLNEITNEDMRPFSALSKAHIPALMTAHIIFPQVDALPVSFSSVWLKDILRKQLGYTGTIFSDDLNMEGANIGSNYADRMLKAREAGCDLILLCNNREAVIQVLDNVPHADHQVEKDKWERLQGQFAKTEDFSPHNHQWQAIQEKLQALSN